MNRIVTRRFGTGPMKPSGASLWMGSRAGSALSWGRSRGSSSRLVASPGGGPAGRWALADAELLKLHLPPPDHRLPSASQRLCSACSMHALQHTRAYTPQQQPTLLVSALSCK